jgi:tRNA nucleotidyltransferase/poly(A) polymerase
LYEGEITEELITNEEKSELPELQSARETIKMLMSQNVKQSKTLMQHYKALDALVKRDEEVKKERQIFNLLNNNYNILQERYDTVEKTVREQKNKIDKDNKFFKAYFDHISQEIELLQVELIGLSDKIKSTPAYKLNEQQVMNQFVMQANKIIAAHKASIANYSEGYNAE